MTRNLSPPDLGLDLPHVEASAACRVRQRLAPVHALEADPHRLLVAEEPTSPTGSTEELAQSNVTRRLLLVAPSSFSRRVLGHLFKRSGWEVNEVSEASLSSLPIEVLTCQVILFGEDFVGSSAVAERIHEAKKRSQEPIRLVMIEPGSTRRMPLDLVDLRVDAVLSRPFSLETLCQEVQDLRHPARLSGGEPGPDVWGRPLKEILNAYPMRPSTMARVVCLFRESCAERLKSLRAALSLVDWRSLSKECHAMKGSVSMFGSARTMQTISALERAIRDCDGHRVGVFIEEVRMAIEGLDTLLNQLTSKTEG